MHLQLAVLEEGDGPSMTSDEPADVEEEEAVGVGEQSAPQQQPATASGTSLPQTPSMEDLSTKKKSHIPGSGLRAPAAGKSEFVVLTKCIVFMNEVDQHCSIDYSHKGLVIARLASPRA